MSDLPKLDYVKLAPTRDYLQDVTLVLGSLQRAFITKHPRQWEYGLDVNMRGPLTKPFIIGGNEIRASIDLVTHKVRLGGNNWPLSEYAAPEIMNNIRLWLESRNVSAELEAPKYSGSNVFDEGQADDYASALWWMDLQFRKISESLNSGVRAPILLYPHHFDLSLVYFPFDDDKQIGLGFSTGDKTITEPYIYLTAYPETTKFHQLELPPEAHRQSSGFSGAILPYAKLRASQNSEQLLEKFAEAFTIGVKLFK